MYAEGGGVLRISSDGDDRRIFLDLKFSILGFFSGRRIWKAFLCVCGSILVKISFSIQNNLKILGSADCVVHVVSCNPFWKFLRLGNSA